MKKMTEEEKDWNKFSNGYYNGIRIGYKERYDCGEKSFNLYRSSSLGSER